MTPALTPAVSAAKNGSRPITADEAEEIRVHLREVESDFSNKVTKLQQDMALKVDGLTIAVFGNPMDDQDHGMLGDLRSVREMVSTKLGMIFVALFGLTGVLVVSAVTIALAVHH